MFEKQPIPGSPLEWRSRKGSEMCAQENSLDQLTGSFFEIPQQDVARLASAVKASNGFVMLFTHPFFETHHPFDRLRNATHEQKVARVEKRFLRFVSAKSHTKPPIFIFEEASKKDATKKRIYAHAPDAKFYMAGTTPKNPDPIMGWGTAFDVFAHVGVEEFILGGMYLRPPGLTKCIGCVNSALEQLDIAFKTSLSSIAFPLTGKEFQKLRHAAP